MEDIPDISDICEQAVRGTAELRGSLRVSLGSSLAVREVIPRMPSFLDKHPALHLDLLLVDHRRGLVTEGIDVALRFIRRPADGVRA
jgi:DNA-binding transcriptional LysR family regulator